MSRAAFTDGAALTSRPNPTVMYRPLLFALVFALAWLFSPANAQTQLITTPRQSPQAITGQTIGMAEVAIQYSRPAARERKVWGELIPYGQVWRAGANENTVFKTTAPLQVNGQLLPTGTYGLHILPTESNWTFIFSSNSTSWGSFSYTKGEDVLRVTVPAEGTPVFQEHLAYSFAPAGLGSGTCQVAWADRQATLVLEMPVHEAALATIRKELRAQAGWDWKGWYEAANYCYTHKVNTKEALAWATRSAFMQPNGKNLLLKAQLTGRMKHPNDSDAQTKTVVATLASDLETSPATWRAYQTAANWALQQNANTEAIAWAKLAADRGQNMTALMSYAAALKATGAEQEAEEAKALAIERGTKGELNNYGYRLLLSGKTTAALQVFKTNTERYPEDPNVWDSLGEGYYRAGQEDAAIEALTKSLSLNPPPNVRANSMKLLNAMDAPIPADR